MKNKEYDWEEMLTDAQTLGNQIKSTEGRIKNIYGIPRGGLVLAVLLSHQLNIPLITDRKEISIKTLIVDDISDTGSQLISLLEEAEKTNSRPLFTATLWMRAGSKFEPSFYVNTMEGSSWIIFPWETKEF